MWLSLGTVGYKRYDAQIVGLHHLEEVVKAWT